MIYVGASGFSYQDWKGPFYPKDLPSSRMLEYYAQQFDCVEINSSYYQLITAKTYASMAARTPDRFKFTVKTHKDITHTPEPVPDSISYFRDSLAPLVETGKLACVLAQYPWGLKCTPENRERIIRLKEELYDFKLVAEFRNASWANEETLELLRKLDIGYCCVDEPKLPGLMPDLVATTSSIAYIRFHGRNSSKWWTSKDSHERYDYLYSAEELQEWIPKIKQADSSAQDTYVLFNNCFNAQSATNAKQTADMLNIKLPKPPAPEQKSLFE